MRDLTGQRFGRLIALKHLNPNKWGSILWECKCDCGKTHTVSSGHLVQGKSKSCGCYCSDVRRKMLEKHGITTGGKPRTFIIWNGMKGRCLYPKSTSYKSYGGRGISICQEWLNFENFHNWAISNGYADDLTIDRIDNDGNYEPNNCRWIRSLENKKRQRKMRFITINQITKNVTSWCKELKISKATAYKHLNVSDQDFINFVLCKYQQVSEQVSIE